MGRHLNPLARRRARQISSDMDVILEVSMRERLIESHVREDGQTEYRMTEYGRGLNPAQRELAFDAGLRRLLETTGA